MTDKSLPFEGLGSCLLEGHRPLESLSPAQFVVKPTFGLKREDVFQADVLRGQLRVVESMPFEGRAQLFDPAPHRPLRSEVWERFRDLAAIDFVTSRVGAGALGIAHGRSWNRLEHHVGHIADLIAL